ncbi:hypothetical protein [Pedobacter punctiformis]|uniref:Uncharacterized protein n=1 Tax=Pedobacter punctiformis TaxID=3004097 RepID=A0ABT4LB38_9SPHI|nr:hypothetical protein [Pedobacter sp. HCMS5-2]MCZ4245120.1 hypothetical protein [Pedobacter sp. HCMS5-2]
MKTYHLNSDCGKHWFNRFFISKLFLVFIISISTFSFSFAQNIPPIIATTWGCKVGNNVYYDWDGTSNVSGGVTYYHFLPGGRYTQWDNFYALQAPYQCTRFVNTSPANMSCSVSGTIGIRGTFQTSSIYCPIDNEVIILFLGGLLFLIYLHFNKRYIWH